LPILFSIIFIPLLLLSFSVVSADSEKKVSSKSARIEHGKPQYLPKNNDAWKSKGRIVGISKDGPDFKITILTQEKKEIRTASSEKTKDGQRAYEIWLEPGKYIMVVSATGYESLDISDLEVKSGNDLRIDLEFSKAVK